jgi:hypothetical protein
MLTSPGYVTHESADLASLALEKLRPVWTKDQAPDQSLGCRSVDVPHLVIESELFEEAHSLAAQHWVGEYSWVCCV